MYGYVRPHQPELRVRELEYYRAVYCGLCKTMGKCPGQCSRLTLSYDFTYFALMRMVLEGKLPSLEKQTCILHPLRKKLMAERDETLEMCAYLSGILVYHKLCDDRLDERGSKRFVAGMAKPYAKALRKKALRHGYLQVDEQVSLQMQKLTELQSQKPMSADQPAEVFGDLMAYLLSYGLEGNTQIIARNIGKHMGRWIYLIDAVDDFDEDRKKGRYNPYLCLWQNTDMTDDRRHTLENALMAELTAVEAALDLCETQGEESRTAWGIVRNVLYMGMPTTAKKILFPEACACSKEKGKTSKRKHKKASQHQH